MEVPPPVPPKDSPYKRAMDAEHVGSPPASASKRKRTAQEDAEYYSQIEGEDYGDDAHTPKRRTRSMAKAYSDADDDSTPAQPRNIKRKKGHQNLSNLNLRHAAAQQADGRESKFQEGSLTDRPSEKPPSAFTRFIRTDSGNVQQVDELMSNYHDGMMTPRDSTEVALEQDKARMSTGVTMARQEQERVKSEAEANGGFFNLGRSFASSFHPITLWNKVWNETKEELKRKDAEEAERKRKLKEAAEARYAQMKAAGQLPTKTFSQAMLDSDSDALEGASNPRDSGVVVDSLRPSIEHRRSDSYGSTYLAPPSQDGMGGLSSEVPHTADKNKTLRGRLHFMRPSLSNLKLGLKRTASELSLGGAAAAHRESSSSASPTKTEFSQGTLKRLGSKVDLRKQHKLSKRVSDLESKLQQARYELDQAISNASPMPKLNGRHERFTPSSTVRTRRFIPGTLPSLPSERILFADHMGLATPDGAASEGYSSHVTTESPNKTFAGEPRHVLELNEDCEDTIKAPRGRRQYPKRADQLFSHINHNIGEQTPQTTGYGTSDLTHLERDHKPDIAEMDPNYALDLPTQQGAEAAQPVQYSSLDDKLKALEENAKAAKGSKKSRKRKSTDTSGLYKPGRGADDDDDDGEWQEAEGQSKKRKLRSGTNSGTPPKKKGSSGASPNGKAAANGKVKKRINAAAKNSKQEDQATIEPETIAQNEEQYSSDEVESDPMADNDAGEDGASVRRSIDSQAQPLEPLYEEEEQEGTATLPLSDEPSTDTPKAAPARFALRSRSASPAKRVPAGAEEQVITNAALVAQRTHGRVTSPPQKEEGVVRPAEVDGETIVVTSGHNGTIGSPAKPTRSRGDRKADFEWPDDVF